MQGKTICALVLGVGGNVSQGIIKALRQCTLDIYIIGACVDKNAPGLYMCDKAFISPYAHDKNFISWYVAICNKHNIDIVFTGVEENIDVILQNREYFEARCQSKFIYPDRTSWEIGSDKYLTCQWLKDNKCNYPRFSLATDCDSLKLLFQTSGFPLIAKPRKGKGSRGIYMIHNEQDLLSIPEPTSYVVEEYIGSADHEYTVGCYCNQQGDLVQSIIMRRILKNGTTSYCEIVENKEIKKEITKICDQLHPVGPVNFQLRLDQLGKPTCFEINVRYSGTTAIRNHFGFHDVEAGVREYVLDENINSLFNYSQGCAIRYDEEIYFNHSLEELMTM